MKPSYHRNPNLNPRKVSHILIFTKCYRLHATNSMYICVVTNSSIRLKSRHIGIKVGPLYFGKQNIKLINIA